MITAAEMKTLQKQYRGEFSMSKTFAMKWPAEATKNQKMLLSRKQQSTHNRTVHHRKLNSESILYVTLTV